MAKITGELFSSSFPIYTIATLGNGGEFYIAGGGGQAKTGVPNAIVSFLLECDGMIWLKIL